MSSPIKSPIVSSLILFSNPAIAKELMPRASAILSIYGDCGTILFVSYFLMDTGCIPESSANFAWVMPMRVRKYFIFSPIVIIFHSFCSLVAIIIAHKNKKVHTNYQKIKFCPICAKAHILKQVFVSKQQI